MVESLEKDASKTNDNDHFLTMNLCEEHHSCQTILIRPTFIIDSTPTNQILLFCRGLEHVVGTLNPKPLTLQT